MVKDAIRERTGGNMRVNIYLIKNMVLGFIHGLIVIFILTIMEKFIKKDNIKAIGLKESNMEKGSLFCLMDKKRFSGKYIVLIIVWDLGKRKKSKMD